MKLGQAHERHQIALVGLERRFKRCFFACVIAQLPPRFGEIEPQRASLGIGLRGGFEVMRRGFWIASIQKFHAAHVLGTRVTRVEAKRFVELTPGLGAPAIPLCLRRARQMLFDIHHHSPEDDRRLAIGSRWLPLLPALWHVSLQP